MGQICFNAIIASLQNFSPITSSSSRPYLCEWNTETRKKEGNKYFNGVIKCAVQRMKLILKEHKKQYFFINEIGPCKMWLMWSFVRFSWALRFFIGKKTLLWDYNIRNGEITTGFPFLWCWRSAPNRKPYRMKPLRVVFCHKANEHFFQFQLATN